MIQVSSSVNIAGELQCSYNVATMSIRKHYIIIGNRRHGYTLRPARSVTTLICRSANIEARFPNDEIPRILSELPKIIGQQSLESDSEAQNEVLRFRVSQREKEEIEDNATEAGYEYVSAYLRDIALKKERGD